MLKAYFHSKAIEAGCDEAGRGCLAGPVVAAAVILPKKIPTELHALNDSKKISEKQRLQLRPLVQKHAIAYSVGIVENDTIDEINILQASFLAMHRALDALQCKPELLLIDGNRFVPYQNIKHKCIVQGDGKYLAIAAASILAKTYRDEHLETLHYKYPVYNWLKNKGYPTKHHREMIGKYGTCEHHRLSFNLLGKELMVK